MNKSYPNLPASFCVVPGKPKLPSILFDVHSSGGQFRSISQHHTLNPVKFRSMLNASLFRDTGPSGSPLHVTKSFVTHWAGPRLQGTVKSRAAL